MSRAQIQKLNVLLARVQQRRNEPRLVSVAGVTAVPSANTNVASPALELARQAAETRPVLARVDERVEREEQARPMPPSSMPPPAAAAVSAAPSSIPPPSQARTPPQQAKPSTSTVPPSEYIARAPTEVLPAAEVSNAPVRVAPSPVQPFDSAVRVTSSPRIDAAKSFGELLELSLALRPKAG